MEQNREQKLNIDAEGKKTSSSNGAIPGAKKWLMNSDQLNFGKYKTVEKPFLPSFYSRWKQKSTPVNQKTEPKKQTGILQNRDSPNIASTPMNHFEIPTAETKISINSKKMETISIQQFCRSEGNLKKRFEEGKKRRKANLSCRRRRSVPQGSNTDRRRRSPSTVRRPTARLSVQIPSHRPPPLSPASCEIFDPNEWPPARRPCLPPSPRPKANWNKEENTVFGHGGW